MKIDGNFFQKTQMLSGYGSNTIFVMLREYVVRETQNKNRVLIVFGGFIVLNF